MASHQVYPDVRRDETVDDFHGVKVVDPYRWLEDVDSPETVEFVKKQVEVTDSYIKQLSEVGPLNKKLKEVTNFPKYSSPWKEGDYWYFWKNTGLQNQSVLYRQKSPKDSEDTAEVLLDPNTLSTDGTVSSAGVSFSPVTGKQMIYRLSVAGSDWNTAYVMDSLTGKSLTDKVEWCKYCGPAWTYDEKGFYYQRYSVPKSLQNEGSDTLKKGKEIDSATNQMIYYHTIGTDQSEDKLVYDYPSEPTWMFGVEVTEDGKYLLITPQNGCERVNRVYIVDINNPKYDSEGKLEPVKFIDNFDANYGYVANNGPDFYFLHSSKKVTRGRLIKMNINESSEKFEVVIPEHEKNVLESVSCTNDHFVVTTLRDVKSVVQIYSMDGKEIKTLDLPIGTITGAGAKRSDKEFYFQFVSFLTPGSIFHYDFGTDKVELYKQIVVPGVDTSNMVVDQIFYKSKDGTDIPMFIIKKKDTVMNGENCTVLYGYGGFNISILPMFATSRLVFVEHFNGIYCIANLRGGNEYGEDWHQQGILDRKQNVFDDFQYAAKYLIEKKYTSPKKLTIWGGSNGGLLTCVCYLQAPELYGCVISQVPVTDMLRFHKFTIGHAWTTDYGCSDKKEDFEYLIKYSPLHTVKRKEGVNYPAIMLLTGDHDDRVVPAHSFKMISEYQYQLGKDKIQTNPILVRIDVKAGHGAGKPLDKQLTEISEIYAFIAKFTNTTTQGL